MSQRSQARSEKGSPLSQRTAEALASILASAPPGSYLPSEPSLSRELGVSRATLREAMRAFEERGMIVRRQGVGALVARQLPVLDPGLEVLESIETLGSRIGLKVEMGDLPVDRRAGHARGAEGVGIP